MKDTLVLNQEDIAKAVKRIAHEIVERNDSGAFALVGIHTRGVFLARRLKDVVSELSDREINLGELDIGFYRDDLTRRGPEPIVHSSTLEFALEGLTVVLVDDVLYTGRTTRAAIDALFDYGRPERIQLAVLIDRGHHELPIKPDYIGKNIPTSRIDRVNVHLDERDGIDEATVTNSDSGGQGVEELTTQGRGR